MEAREKYLFTLIAFFLFCLICWVVYTTPPEPPSQEKIEPPTFMDYEGNTLIEEKDGEIVWELTCDKIRLNSLTQDIELENIRGIFYQQNKETSWELTAERGVYYQLFKVVHVEGNVIVKNNDNAEISSQSLDWFGEQEMLVANGEVKIIKDDTHAFGDMAYSSNGFKHFGLIGNAKILKIVSR